MGSRALDEGKLPPFPPSVTFDNSGVLDTVRTVQTVHVYKFIDGKVFVEGIFAIISFILEFEVAF